MGPFEEHLRDAISINTKRAPLYSDLSGGRSDSVSRWVVLSERIALPLCRVPDLWGRKFLDFGVPIVKEEFMPMETIPEFRETLPFAPASLRDFEPRHGNSIGAKILRGYRTGGFSEAANVAGGELKSLEADPTFHPMLRHLLESVVRVCNLAPLHEKRRLELSIPDSTIGLSKWLFFSHFSAFQFASWIDSKAAPLHAEGLPILHQDVPHIPPLSEFYEKLNVR